MPHVIVIGARGIPDVEGGAEKNAENLFPLLAQRGYEVEVVGISRFIRAPDYKGVSLTGVPTLRFMNSDKLVYNFFALLYALTKRPDLVHLQGTNSALFLWLYKLFGLRVVLRYGSSDSRFRKWGPIGRTVIRYCELQLRLADHVIAVSDSLKLELTAGKKVRKVEVIPNGVDIPTVTPQAENFWSGLGLKKHKYILSVGRLTVDKDFETLVRAVKLIGNNDMKLVVAGGPDEKGHCERLLALGDDQIRFIGRVDRSLLAALYANCAIYAHCSHYEGLSNAVLEAISHRCPLVISDIDSHRELPLGALSYFPVGDAQALSVKLAEALSRPDDFITRVEGFFDWSNVGERVHGIYQSVLTPTEPSQLVRVPTGSEPHQPE